MDLSSTACERRTRVAPPRFHRPKPRRTTLQVSVTLGNTLTAPSTAVDAVEATVSATEIKVLWTAVTGADRLSNSAV